MAKTLPGRFAAGLSLERQWRKGQGGAKTRSPNHEGNRRGGRKKTDMERSYTLASIMSSRNS